MKFFEPYFDRLEYEPNLRSFLIEELTSPHRHYHGVGHHALMLKECDRGRMRSSLGRRGNLGVLSAVFFHDIVYDPARSDNEEQAAATMRMWLDPQKHDVDFIEMLILATKSHNFKDVSVTVAERYNQAAVWRAHAFLKADLSILWSNRVSYRWYANGVRAEYAHVPNDLYRTGRAKVLDSLYESLVSDSSGFAEQDFAVYQTANTLLKAMKTNIEWEKAELARGSFDL